MLFVLTKTFCRSVGHQTIDGPIIVHHKRTLSEYHQIFSATTEIQLVDGVQWTLSGNHADPGAWSPNSFVALFLIILLILMSITPTICGAQWTGRLLSAQTIGGERNAMLCGTVFFSVLSPGSKRLRHAFGYHPRKRETKSVTLSPDTPERLQCWPTFGILQSPCKDTPVYTELAAHWSRTRLVDRSVLRLMCARIALT